MRTFTGKLDLSRSRVLVVDDLHPSRELMLQVLTGFRVKNVQACASPEEARQQIAARVFDLIIIDGEMPGEDGISLTRHVRAEPKQPNFTAPILLVSSSTPIEKVILARDAGANMVVKKPIAPAVLLARIKWLACNDRDFVKADSYCGPDRRFKSLPLSEGIEERRADNLALTASPDRAMSQDEVDSLFG